MAYANVLIAIGMAVSTQWTWVVVIILLACGAWWIMDQTDNKPPESPRVLHEIWLTGLMIVATLQVLRGVSADGLTLLREGARGIIRQEKKAVSLQDRREGRDRVRKPPVKTGGKDDHQSTVFGDVRYKFFIFARIDKMNFSFRVERDRRPFSSKVNQRVLWSKIEPGDRC